MNKKNGPVRVATEEDREIVHHLVLHTEQAYQANMALHAARQQAKDAAHIADEIGFGLISYDPGERIVFFTPLAQRLVKTYFGKLLRPRSPLPDDLKDYARSQETVSLGQKRRSRIVRGFQAELTVRAAIHASQDTRFLILSEKRQWQEKSAESFRRFGLTGRECEVLHWIIEGKTNIEIGIILRASHRTVGKHVERVLQKMGAENRNGACAKAMRMLVSGVMN